MLALRDYQEQGIADLRRSYASGKRAPLLVMPTGAGKTTMFSYMAKGAAERGKRVLILTHRTELLRQSSATLARAGLDHGLIMPGFAGERSQVAVASVQTLHARLKRAAIPSYDFVIVDEAHLYRAASFGTVVSHFAKAHLLACTATPIRTDGQGLGIDAGGFCDDIIIGPSTKELVHRGFLSPCEIFAPPVDLDLSGVHKRGGDFVSSEVESRVNKSSITGSAVEHYARLSPGEPAIVFCASKAHAASVSQSFKAAGFTSEVVHGGLDRLMRAQRLQGLAAGAINVIASVDLLTTGTDIPSVSVGIWLRPTSSRALWLQGCGRILRCAPGKRRALILDHVGNALRLECTPTSTMTWSLDGEERSKRSRDDDETTVRQCNDCFSVWERGNTCPACGLMIKAKPRLIKEVDGELKRLTEEEVERARRAKRQEVGRAQTIDDLKRIAKERGYSPGWVFQQTKIKRIRR